MELGSRGLEQGFTAFSRKPCMGDVMLASGSRSSLAFQWAGLAIVAFATLAVGIVLFGVEDGGHAQPSNRIVSDPSASGHGSSGAGMHATPFSQSFGLVALTLCATYLVALIAWAAWRKTWLMPVRHLATAATMLVLTVLYLLARGGLDYNGHNWNRSFADASVLLYAATMAIGPLARLWRPASHALAWRRETGIWATIAAAIHVGIFWEWSLNWDWRPFFYPGLHDTTSDSLMGDPASGVVASAFNLANVVGLVALAYAVVLATTSNDASQRLFKRGWTWIMQRATTMWLLVLLHTWLFAYYITREQALPVGTVWVGFWAVLLLQTLAFTKTVWLRHEARPSAAEA